MSNIGWARIHRRLTDSNLWLSEKFTRGQAWVDLFTNANHLKGSFWIRGNEIQIERGQIGWSEVTMSNRWRWSRNKVRGFLKWLENEQQISQRKLYKLTTIITILNYELYQSEQQTIQQKDNRQNTNKNDKNNNKKVVYADNTIKIAEIMELEPTKGLEKYLNVTYKDYAFEAFTDHYIQWCEDNKKKPTIAQWMNFARGDDAKGKLKRKRVE